MNAGRRAVLHELTLHERITAKHGAVRPGPIRMAGPFRQHLVDQLHRDLRVRLIVVELDVNRTAFDAAVLVHADFEPLQRILLRLAEERAEAVSEAIE